MTIVEMCVHMDCSGCESKIKKALRRLEGVDEVEVDMTRQKVTVTGWADQKKVLKAVRKTGRRAVLWPYSYPGPGGEHHQVQAQALYHQNQPAAAAVHTFHPAYGPAPASSYNYYKHGYDEYFQGHGYHQHAGQSIVDERARSLFSDENPNACSIM